MIILAEKTKCITTSRYPQRCKIKIDEKIVTLLEENFRFLVDFRKWKSTSIVCNFINNVKKIEKHFNYEINYKNVHMIFPLTKFSNHHKISIRNSHVFNFPIATYHTDKNKRRRATLRNFCVEREEYFLQTNRLECQEGL